MIIIHKLDNFLFELFPKTKVMDGSNIDKLRKELISYYTFGPYKPKVEIDEIKNIVSISIDINLIATQKKDFDTVISLCEKRRFRDAKPILMKLIETNPANSEYHRVLGQIYSDEGNSEEALNCLIDALKWDPKNCFALIMMGNILSKHKNDITSATKYYDQAIKINPRDNIAINNLGANLMQSGKIEQAIKYFEMAYEIDPKYPHTTFALGLINDIKKDYLKAFDFAIQSMTNSPPPTCSSNQLFNHILTLAQETATKYIGHIDGKEIFRQYRSILEEQSNKPIEIVEDASIPTAAKIEIAENYNKGSHVIRYKNDYPAVEHLVMHELVHLYFNLEARKVGANKLFISTNEHKKAFIVSTEKTINGLNQQGLNDKNISDFISALFDGINRQIFNTPIDLFIENYLYNTHPDLRPYQFLSLHNLISEGIKAVTDTRAAEIIPPLVTDASKILNIVNALQFKELFGIDLIYKFNPTQQQLRISNELYKEYFKNKDMHRPAMEYELINNWAKKLNLASYFSIVSEDEYRKNYPASLTFIDSVEKTNPKNNVSFSEQSPKHMATVMYCLSALQYFQDKSNEEITKAGFEIAKIGTQGIDPLDTEKKYHLTSIPDKEFSGLQLLAFMYVAFQTIDPNLDIGIDFKKEYKIAKDMLNKSN
ncbi:MAG: tetratricopeptide repeat protein [Elusimicrobiota bacterium]